MRIVWKCQAGICAPYCKQSQCCLPVTRTAFTCLARLCSFDAVPDFADAPEVSFREDGIIVHKQSRSAEIRKAIKANGSCRHKGVGQRKGIKIEMHVCVGTCDFKPTTAGVSCEQVAQQVNRQTCAVPPPIQTELDDMSACVICVLHQLLEDTCTLWIVDQDLFDTAREGDLHKWQ